MALTEVYVIGEVDETIFNVSFPVGANADNWWTDIMLVQYFIRIIYLLNTSAGSSWKLSKVSLSELGNLPDPHKDFKALTKTAKWIRFFQIDATLENGYPMIANGRVEKGKTGSSDFSRPIYLLNMVYKVSLMDFGIDDWHNYALNDASMPEMLKTQLKSRIIAV